MGMGQRTQGDGPSNTNDPKMPQTSGPVMPNATQFSGATDVMFDGKRIRKTMIRKTVDYNTSVIKYLEVRNRNSSLHGKKTTICLLEKKTTISSFC